uniref:Uncharacterized protein n=1 Tax=Panagrolaimus sp. JU765 TaxID=591449 RepID=A0AC34QCM7_9BILA
MNILTWFIHWINFCLIFGYIDIRKEGIYDLYVNEEGFSIHGCFDDIQQEFGICYGEDARDLVYVTVKMSEVNLIIVP